MLIKPLNYPENSSPVGLIVRMYQLTKEKMYFIVGNTIRKQVTF